MKTGAPGSFGAHLKALRVSAGFTQEELATIAGLSVHAVSALERGERRRPHVDTVRALAAALDLVGPARDALMKTARTPTDEAAVDELGGVSLPLALTSLLGRDDDVRTLLEWLADPGARLITLVGPGGVGKTRLALEIARRVGEDGQTHAVFVELAGIRDPAFVASAIAEALGLSDVTAVDLARRVRVSCSEERPTLLVLDNCEQVLDAAPLVADLVTSVASLRVLATSRAALRVRGERLYAVGPLAVRPDSDALAAADLVRIPAVRLFVERVRDVQPAFRLTAANAQTVLAICRRLDALPLALELAAPWMKVLTAENLLRRLEDGVMLPSAGVRDLPERQQTIDATMAWSYQLLDPVEQHAFRRFGALPGRFCADAAAAVLGGTSADSFRSEAALMAAAGLIDKSLLYRVDTPVASRPLYQMLETVRTYAALELAAMGERDDALEGLARYCFTEAARAEQALTGPSQIECLDYVRDDLDNYRCVLAWLIDRGRSIEACNIACGLMFFWLIRGRAAEGLQWYERTLNLPDLPPAVESRVLVAAAVMSHTQGDPARARARVVRALELSRAEGDTSVMVHAENLLGHVEQTSGNAAAASDLFTRSRDGFRTLGIPWGAGNALIGLASVALATGDTDRAERLLDEATAVLRDAGPWFLNLPLYLRAILAVRRAEPDVAIAFVRESLTRSRMLHDRFAFVYALIPLAAAAAQKGHDAWVARILGARDAATERAGTTVSTASMRDLRDMAERPARARLGADRWARAYAAGRSASIDWLLNDIDSART
ncbi:MAG TPA: helix-turn-helix domain-containing protein [Vicinamibacterales bacterium]|nr:helix-turn-helix domain-containing protein [Vicinamibacterales bacterium]